MIHNRILIALSSVVALAFAAGCDDGGNNDATGGSGNAMGGATGSGGSTGSGMVFPLLPNADGFVPADGSSGTNVTGAWYAYGDSLGDMKCTAAGHAASECSMITAPTGMKFPPTDLATAKMCTQGTAAKVLKGSNGDDYSNMFGAGIGIDFNHADGTVPKAEFDASAYKGIQFKIEGLPSAFRVEFPATSTEGTTDGANFADGQKGWGNTTLTDNAVNTVLFSNVGQPTTKMVGLDVAHLLGVQFHVPTSTSSATPFNYCISGLALIK